MSFENRVVWTEGMFLRPQHFQQQDRYHESLIEARTRPLRAYFWGFHELEIDSALLKLGKLAVNRCRCIFPDGSPVNIPEYEVKLEILEVEKGLAMQVVHLALPVKRQGAPDTQLEDDAQALVRFGAQEVDTFDSTSSQNDPAKVQVGIHNLRLLLDQDDRSGYTTLPVARIKEARDDGEIVLDPSFVQPLLDVNSHPKVGKVLEEIAGSLNLRAEALAGRIRDSGRQGTSEIADYLMLQMANRVEPWLLHLATVKPLHPMELYGELLQLTGELATFSSSQKRPPELPLYQHDELERCIHPLNQLLNQYLSTVSETSAVSLELVERKYGIHVSPITDRTLIKKASFVLAVKAHLKPDQIRARFPGQVKIAPVEKIRDLVNAQLPGIGLLVLPVAPRQIPYHSGYTYFQLDSNSDFWPQLKKSSGFALHVGADFPGMELEFWAIRE